MNFARIFPTFLGHLLTTQKVFREDGTVIRHSEHFCFIISESAEEFRICESEISGPVDTNHIIGL
jgi:hypothetical protein